MGRPSNDYFRSWRKAHPNSVKKTQKDYRLKNPKNRLWHNAQQRAKEKDIPFSITEADFEIAERCPFCSCYMEPGHGKLHCRSPSLDRLYPQDGYVPGNVLVICHWCNRRKAEMTPSELRQMADNIERFAQCGL